jgi:hypothetical protein
MKFDVGNWMKMLVTEMESVCYYLLDYTAAEGT